MKKASFKMSLTDFISFLKNNKISVDINVTVNVKFDINN